MTMYELLTSPSDLAAKVGSSTDKQEIGVLREIEAYSKRVSHIISANNDKGTNSTDGLCLLLSRDFNTFLKEHNYPATVLQGDVEIGKNDWLEHHISFVKLPSSWITIDFSANQLEWFANVPFVVLIGRPDKRLLGEALKRFYRWWIPQKEC